MRNLHSRLKNASTEKVLLRGAMRKTCMRADQLTKKSLSRGDLKALIRCINTYENCLPARIDVPHRTPSTLQISSKRLLLASSMRRFAQIAGCCTSRKLAPSRCFSFLFIFPFFCARRTNDSGKKEKVPRFLRLVVERLLQRGMAIYRRGARHQSAVPSGSLTACGSSRPRRRTHHRAPPQCGGAGCTWRGAPTGTAHPS